MDLYSKKLLLRFLAMWFLSTVLSQTILAQSFYKEKEPKLDFYRIGLGAGTFFSAPRISYDEIENKIVPVISIGFGRKYSDHFSLKLTGSFQQFSSSESVEEIGDDDVLSPIFQGFNYALDLTPTFNLLPSYHHMSRPLIDFKIGLGIGYLLTYRTENFSFQERDFDFSFFESSFYFPIRASSVFRLGILSDLEVEGVFFYTFLNDSNGKGRLEKDSDHFGQLNLVYRRYFK